MTAASPTGVSDTAGVVRIGVLALQGSFREHITSLKHLPGVVAVEIRTKQELAAVDGLVIPGTLLQIYSAININSMIYVLSRIRIPPLPRPGSSAAPSVNCPFHVRFGPRSLLTRAHRHAGGESTTMGLIAERWGLIPELRAFTAAGKPVWGTCAGLIFLADRAIGASSEQDSDSIKPL